MSHVAPVYMSAELRFQSPVRPHDHDEAGEHAQRDGVAVAEAVVESETQVHEVGGHHQQLEGDANRPFRARRQRQTTNAHHSVDDESVDDIFSFVAGFIGSPFFFSSFDIISRFLLLYYKSD